VQVLDGARERLAVGVERKWLVRTDDDDEVVGGRSLCRQGVLAEPERLAQESLDAVPARSRTDAAADRDAEPVGRRAVRRRVDRDRLGRSARARPSRP